MFKTPFYARGRGPVAAMSTARAPNLRMAKPAGLKASPRTAQFATADHYYGGYPSVVHLGGHRFFGLGGGMSPNTPEPRGLAAAIFSTDQAEDSPPQILSRAGFHELNHNWTLARSSGGRTQERAKRVGSRWIVATVMYGISSSQTNGQSIALFDLNGGGVAISDIAHVPSLMVSWGGPDYFDAYGNTSMWAYVHTGRFMPTGEDTFVSEYRFEVYYVNDKAPGEHGNWLVKWRIVNGKLQIDDVRQLYRYQEYMSQAPDYDLRPKLTAYAYVSGKFLIRALHAEHQTHLLSHIFSMEHLQAPLVREMAFEPYADFNGAAEFSRPDPYNGLLLLTHGVYDTDSRFLHQLRFKNGQWVAGPTVYRFSDWNSAGRFVPVSDNLGFVHEKVNVSDPDLAGPLTIEAWPLNRAGWIEPSGQWFGVIPEQKYPYVGPPPLPPSPWTGGGQGHTYQIAYPTFRRALSLGDVKLDPNDSYSPTSHHAYKVALSTGISRGVMNGRSGDDRAHFDDVRF